MRVTDGVQVNKLDYVRAGEPQRAWDHQGFEVDYPSYR
jgi:hypothetical protein